MHLEYDPAEKSLKTSTIDRGADGIARIDDDVLVRSGGRYLFFPDQSGEYRSRRDRNGEVPPPRWIRYGQEFSLAGQGHGLGCVALRDGRAWLIAPQADLHRSEPLELERDGERQLETFPLATDTTGVIVSSRTAADGFAVDGFTYNWNSEQWVQVIEEKGLTGEAAEDLLANPGIRFPGFDPRRRPDDHGRTPTSPTLPDDVYRNFLSRERPRIFWAEGDVIKRYPVLLPEDLQVVKSHGTLTGAAHRVFGSHFLFDEATLVRDESLLALRGQRRTLFVDTWSFSPVGFYCHTDAPRIGEDVECITMPIISANTLFLERKDLRLLPDDEVILTAEVATGYDIAGPDLYKLLSKTEWLSKRAELRRRQARPARDAGCD